MARAKKKKGLKEKSAAIVAPPEVRALEYKVVELSHVDEGSIQETVNTWAVRGWNFDGVQFAMRESSKRPSMAFVFFTRPGAVIEREASPVSFRSEQESFEALRELTVMAEPSGQQRTDPWERLAELAEGEN